MACPVCSCQQTEVIRRHTLAMAAEHFVPRDRAAERNEKLRQTIRRLWSGAESVEIHRCRWCGFAFPIPYVAGDVAFYNLAFGNGQYPRDRWEFGRTLDVLHPIAASSPHSLKLLESGAGMGWFLEKVRRSTLADRFQLEALEFDDAAIGILRRRGFSTSNASLPDLLGSTAYEGKVDVICMFHTLEHMARVADVFQAFDFLLAPGGHVFISVPNAAAIDQQEETVRFWDMPPNHVGRWNLGCFEVLANQYGLRVVEWAVEPRQARWQQAWHLALYQVNSRAYDAHTIEHLVSSIQQRHPRRIARGLNALAWVPLLWIKAGSMLGQSLWVHLKRR
jgi:2-polyprenyl-3-methyl-5-hydroxy-6-metoxy-1,4-benzoquinol methylase